jgi:purine-nucleoside phosphorylase
MTFRNDRQAFEKAYARRSANNWRQQEETPGYQICDWADRILVLDSDPAYGEQISSMLEHVEIQSSFLPGADSAAFESMAGIYQGKKVSILHTGITPYSFGASYMDFTLERLRGFSTKRILVIGEATGIQEEIQVGDILLPLSVIRDDDIHLSYANPNLPAAGDAELSREVLRQASRLNISGQVHSGIAWSCGNGAGVYDPALVEKLTCYHSAGVLGNCLGAAAAYLLGKLLGHRVASCWLVADTLYAPITWSSMFPRMDWGSGWSQMVELALATLTAD